MTYSGLAVGLADELYAALRNSTTQYNLCFTASVSVREASHLLNHQTFHLLIADLEYLRDKRQTEWLSGIRRISFIPVIILSDAPERDLGGMIQLGADICISGRCPCSTIANLTYAQLRRYTEYNHYNDPGGAGVSSFQVGDIFIDPARRQVEVHGHLVSLRPREFSLLLYFMRNPRIVLTAEQTGIGQMRAMTLAFAISAVWWLAATVPLLRKYRQLHYVPAKRHIVRESFRRLADTLGHIRQEREVFLFLLAFFCYIDGVYTIIDMATAYGTALGLDTPGLLLALLMTQAVAFPATLVFGRLAGIYSSRDLISVCIVAYMFIALFAFSLDSQTKFWILAVCVGLFQGGVQALSRSHFARIIPKDRTGEYFGIFDICGKGASFLGTMLVSMTTQLTGSMQSGIGSLVILFLLGLVLFRKSCKKTAGEM